MKASLRLIKRTRVSSMIRITPLAKRRSLPLEVPNRSPALTSSTKTPTSTQAWESCLKISLPSVAAAKLHRNSMTELQLTQVPTFPRCSIEMELDVPLHLRWFNKKTRILGQPKPRMKPRSTSRHLLKHRGSKWTTQCPKVATFWTTLLKNSTGDGLSWTTASMKLRRRSGTLQVVESFPSRVRCIRQANKTTCLAHRPRCLGLKSWFQLTISREKKRHRKEPLGDHRWSIWSNQAPSIKVLLTTPLQTSSAMLTSWCPRQWRPRHLPKLKSTRKSWWRQASTPRLRCESKTLMGLKPGKRKRGASRLKNRCSSSRVKLRC